MKRLKKLIIFLVIGLVMVIFAVLGLESIFLKETSSSIFRDFNEVPSRTTVIILGASVHANGDLSPILKDRVDTAIKLYKRGKVKTSWSPGTIALKIITKFPRWLITCRKMAFPRH